jgi:hypothetical protein
MYDFSTCRTLEGEKEVPLSLRSDEKKRALTAEEGEKKIPTAHNTDIIDRSLLN